VLSHLPAMLAAAAVLGAQTAPQPASVAGTVTNSVTGEPILRAHVMVRWMSDDRQKGPQTYGALTNEKGEFTITAVPPGGCWMDAERVGFVPPSQRESFPLSSGTHKEGVKLSLTPTGAVAGRVVNAAGEPVQNVDVSAEMGNGNSSSTTSDDKGEFRIGGLRPGKYRVKAAPQWIQFPPEIRTGGSVEQHDAATYYPDSLDAKTAQRLEVKAGAEVSGVDIQLVRTPMVLVSGKVTGMPADLKNVMVNVQPSGQGANVRADGSFTIWRLDPGKYTLQVQHWGGQTPVMSAPVEIEVTSVNLEHVELHMVPPFDIAAQVHFDDEQARESPKPPTRPDGTSPPAPPQQRRVQLFPVNGQNVQMVDSKVGDDDSFTLERVQPAKYRVVLNGTSGYVKSVRAGDAETDGDILDVRTGAPGPVTVTVSSNFCEISGTVSDSKGAVKNARVLLVSQEDPSVTQSSGSDSSGTYKFRVPPGKYKLAAVDEDALTWGMLGPDLDDYEVESVELSAGDKITKDLRRK
jgi:hypothetical protein